MVVLDLKALLEETQERVGLGGRLAGALPDDAAEITVLRSDQLELAQDVFNTLNAAARSSSSGCRCCCSRAR